MLGEWRREGRKKKKKQSELKMLVMTRVLILLFIPAGFTLIYRKLYLFSVYLLKGADSWEKKKKKKRKKQRNIDSAMKH